MELTITVERSLKEIHVELSGTAEKFQKALEAAFAAGSLWLDDKDGRKIFIPTSKICSIEISGEGSGKKVGF